MAGVEQSAHLARSGGGVGWTLSMGLGKPSVFDMSYGDAESFRELRLGFAQLWEAQTEEKLDMHSGMRTSREESSKLEKARTSR
jgi:hypothetical protein